MRQRNLNPTLKVQEREVQKQPRRRNLVMRTNETLSGSGVTVFDEDGEWTGMMMMNSQISNKSAVFWIVPPEDDLTKWH